MIRALPQEINIIRICKIINSWLFNVTFNSSNYIESSNEIIDEYGTGRKRLLPNFKYYPGIYLED
jgi:hypothetical protein